MLMVHQVPTLVAGNMEGNTTAPAAAETVWINVGAMRGAETLLDFQLLEFSQRASPRDVARQVPATMLWMFACVIAPGAGAA